MILMDCGGVVDNSSLCILWELATHDIMFVKNVKRSKDEFFKFLFALDKKH